MGENDLIIESLRLMGIGMGIVFSFLLLLIGLLRVMSAVAIRLAPAEPQPPQMPLTAGVSPASSADDDVIAVIAAAIGRYRARR
ncbi:MAG: OadG family protein [Thiohalocapsa sp.]|jgi:oxaloacetate decarboxylase gamma subunit|nr:OadG family protein [Thiohalocapsa sp.]MCF7991071.1 OadG family protein [Thiohalocapsa sp.]